MPWSDAGLADDASWGRFIQMATTHGAWVNVERLEDRVKTKIASTQGAHVVYSNDNDTDAKIKAIADIVNERDRIFGLEQTADVLRIELSVFEGVFREARNQLVRLADELAWLERTIKRIGTEWSVRLQKNSKKDAEEEKAEAYLAFAQQLAQIESRTAWMARITAWINALEAAKVEKYPDYALTAKMTAEQQTAIRHSFCSSSAMLADLDGRFDAMNAMAADTDAGIIALLDNLKGKTSSTI